MTTPVPVPLSERQERIFDVIRDHMTKYGRAPTIREIGRAVGISSTSVVLYHLGRLSRAGRLVRGFNVARGIEIPDGFMVFVGDEVLGTDEDGRRVRVRLIEPVAKAA